MAKTLLVIGLDGAAFDLLKPWAEQRELPHLAQFMSEGVAAPLESTLPYLSPTAWSSFLTGVNPGKHGVFGFIEANARVDRPFSQSLPLVNSHSIRAPALWQQMNAQGKTVGLLNVPITWPPQPVDGFMISDSIFTPDEDSDYAFPEDLKARLLQAVPAYHVRPYTFHGPTPQHIEEVTFYTAKQTEAALWLLEHASCDVFIVVYSGVDVLQHAFWQHLAQGDGAGDEQLGSLLGTFYRTVDESIGRLISWVGPETPAVLMSDHGFALGRRIFYTNRWLHEMGLLSFQEEQRGWKSRLMEKGLGPEQLLGLLKRMDVFNLRQRWSSRAGLVARDRFKRAVRNIGPAIDWTKTQAYATGEQEPFIYVNLQGRQPMGIVQPGKPYEALRDRLIDELGRLQDAQTGELVVGSVYRREELYSGPHLAQAPDLIYDFRVPGYTSSDVIATPKCFDDQRDHSGIHSRNGIFVASGPGIRQGVWLDGPRIIDLAPTLMYLAGLQVPQGMDGKVLSDILDDTFLSAHPIRYTSQSAGLPITQGDYVADEETQVRDRLRDLGYL